MRGGMHRRGQFSGVGVAGARRTPLDDSGAHLRRRMSDSRGPDARRRTSRSGRLLTDEPEHELHSPGWGGLARRGRPTRVVRASADGGPDSDASPPSTRHTNCTPPARGSRASRTSDTVGPDARCSRSARPWPEVHLRTHLRGRGGTRTALPRLGGASTIGRPTGSVRTSAGGGPDSDTSSRSTRHTNCTPPAGGDHAIRTSDAVGPDVLTPPPNPAELDDLRAPRSRVRSPMTRTTIPPPPPEMRRTLRPGLPERRVPAHDGFVGRGR